MKKKVYLFMGLCLLMLAGGCAKKDIGSDLDSTTDTETTDTTDTTDDAAEFELPKVENYVASDYVTLGEYKGIEVAVEQKEVTDEDINTAIQEELKANATQEEVTDRAVESGDTVNIDFEGLLDGEAFDGGTAQGYDLEIGSNSFIPGFEEGLIGAKIGDKKALDLTFPEDYSADLAGKAVVFNVTINSISKSIVPELTEEYVTTNTDYETIDAYKEGIRTELQTTNEETAQNEKASSVMATVIENSTIKELPQTLLDFYNAQVGYQFEQEAAAYGMDIATYIAEYGMTQEDYEAYVKSLVEAYATRDLVINAVAQAEKMEATDEEYTEAVTKYLSYYGVETEEELLKQISKEEIQDSVVMQKAYNYIIEQAVVK